MSIEKVKCEFGNIHSVQCVGEIKEPYNCLGTCQTEDSMNEPKLPYNKVQKVSTEKENDFQKIYEDESEEEIFVTKNVYDSDKDDHKLKV